MPDPEACSAASSDLAESMLLARSSSEHLDVPPPRNTAKLKLDWSVEREEITPSCLYKQILGGLTGSYQSKKVDSIAASGSI